nr:hypothetical protein CFP56_79457 [Quercus suber]
MWLARSHADRRGGGNGLVAVAIDRDKGSQNALKWSIDHLVLKGQTLILLHVKLKPALLSSSASLSSPRLPRLTGIGDVNSLICKDPDQRTRDLFLPFRCFCTRKDVSAWVPILNINSLIALSMITSSLLLGISTNFLSHQR